MRQVHIWLEQPIEGAIVSINEFKTTTNKDGWAELNVSPGITAAQLTIKIKEYTYSKHVDLDSSLPNQDISIGNVPQTSKGAIHLPPLELATGLGQLDLTVSGTDFALNGKVVKLRGFSSFALLKRYVDGEDITPQIKEMQNLGVHSPRIFLRCKNLFTLEPVYYHDYFIRLDNLSALLNNNNLIPQYEVLVDCWELDQAKRLIFVNQVCDVLRAHSVLFDLVNEFDTQWQKVNPLSFEKPDRLLCSRGSGGSATNPPVPSWDFASFHPRRDEKWLISIPKDSDAIVNGYPGYAGVHCPLYYDEPKGFSNGQRADRSNSPSDAFKLGAMLSLWTAGGAFHSDSGRLSNILNDTEHDCAIEFFRGMAANG